MEEKILEGKKHGMRNLIIGIALMIVGIVGLVGGGTTIETDGFIVGLIIIVGSIPFLIIPLFLFAGLRVLKPQEALVLTLFGKYIGTLKGEGFYAVNPFCSAVNPASDTKLNQSGDVKTLTSAATV